MTRHQALTTPRTWLTPLLLVVGLALALPSVYLAGTVDPQGHLRDMPVALVVEPQTPNAYKDAAMEVSRAIEAGVGDEIALERMTGNQLADAMAEDRVAGAVVIPADFDSSLAGIVAGTGTIAIPTVSILTNAGDGGLSTGLLVGNLTPIIRGVAEGLGARLVQEKGAAELTAADAALLSRPFDISTGPYAPLPENSGMGMSAFYYALVLVLLGFIGASLVNPLVDAALGFIPSELGPLVERRPYTAETRRTTFLAKVAVLGASAPIAALAVQLMARVFGVVVDDPIVLWCYSSAVIAAVGFSALAVFSAFGSGIGSLVNTLFFVALAMVSSGGTVPLEATPSFFRWFSTVSPFRHVIDGTRALFYFEGNSAAGLADAWLSVALGGGIGLILGLVVTTAYGRVPSFSRHPRTSD